LLMKTLLLGIMFFSYAQLIGQNLPVARNYQKAYDKHSRSADGGPGANYWQNSADYTIQVSFEPTSRSISGTETIIYKNNSPDTLTQIWFKLYPNVYKKGSVRNFQIEPADVSEGVKIEDFNIDDKSASTNQLKIAGTNMWLAVPGLFPGKEVQFNLSFSYILNKTSHQRTGMIDDSSAFIAYFFPRIAVYDDIDGWNKIPYTGTQEFYNDFCNFHVQVSVPGNYVVWATGSLLNQNELFSGPITKRIADAERSDAITKIIDINDINVTTQNASNAWKFEADDVTEFAFATSNHYIWYASSVVVDSSTQRRTRVDAVFNPAHRDYFEVVDFARKTVESMSHRFPAWPYPYSHETVFDGLDQMEYPMMVNDNPLEDRADEIELTDHEIFHTMFPFYVGINETKYAWMDEGWATIGEWLLSPMIDSSIADEYGMNSYNTYADYDFDMPVTTLSTQQSGNSYFLNAYPKPAMGYLYVRDMLGDTLFTKALRYYIEQWHGKHPIPLDFFNCMNTGSGKNLNWFWKKWFYDPGAPDLAISNVKRNGEATTITIQMKGSKPVPINLTVYYADGSIQKLHQSIAAWETSNTTSIIFTASHPIRKLVLGELHDADINPNNNVYMLNEK
jgi:hypothetical protein